MRNILLFAVAVLVFISTSLLIACKTEKDSLILRAITDEDPRYSELSFSKEDTLQAAFFQHLQYCGLTRVETSFADLYYSGTRWNRAVRIYEENEEDFQDFYGLESEMYVFLNYNRLDSLYPDYYTHRCGKYGPYSDAHSKRDYDD